MTYTNGTGGLGESEQTGGSGGLGNTGGRGDNGGTAGAGGFSRSDFGGTNGSAGTGGFSVTGGTGGGGQRADASPDLSPDLAPDVGPVVGRDAKGDTAVTCPVGSACTSASGGRGLCKYNVCSTCAEPADDAVCAAVYGAGHLCIKGACTPGTCHSSQQCTDKKICDGVSHTCVVCPSDAACKADSAYGSQSICLAGRCLVGNCHDTNADCSKGQICGLSVPHSCAACTADTQCAAKFASGTLCVEGTCVAGECRSTSDCTAANDGLICGAKTPNTCGGCSSDAQCQADSRYRDIRTLCKTSAGSHSGECMVNACSHNGQACAANKADFCCEDKCVPGNCCQDSDCIGRGTNFTCINNTCTQCQLALGNESFVDPVNGSDAIGTGSGRAGGAAMAKCAFRTITRALRWIGDNPPKGTTIVIVGAAGATTDLFTAAPVGSTEPVEADVIVVPPNVKITTANGPIRFKLRKDEVAFRFVGDGASLAPVGSARLTIDGSASSSGAGLVFQLDNSTSVATVENVAIENTGGDGIRVQVGKVVLGPGLAVRGAGTTSNRRSGLVVTGGSVELKGGTGAANTLIEDNREYGIEVSGAGEVDLLDGQPVIVPAPSGAGTVVIRGNDLAGVFIAQAGATPLTNDLTGLVSWGNKGPGLKVLAGSKLRLRKSVLLANIGSGVVVGQADATPLGNDLSGIDLGVAFDAGANILQMNNAVTAHPNSEAGLCVTLAPTQGDHSLAAMGNVFAGGRNCATVNPGTITTSDNCGDQVDLAVPVVVDTTIKVETIACRQ